MIFCLPQKRCHWLTQTSPYSLAQSTFYTRGLLYKLFLYHIWSHDMVRPIWFVISSCDRKSCSPAYIAAHITSLRIRAVLKFLFPTLKGMLSASWNVLKSTCLGMRNAEYFDNVGTSVTSDLLLGLNLFEIMKQIIWNSFIFYGLVSKFIVSHIPI